MTLNQSIGRTAISAVAPFARERELFVATKHRIGLDPLDKSPQPRLFTDVSSH